MGRAAGAPPMGTGISAADLEARLSSGDGTIVLDTRPPAEYAAGHVAGAASARCGSMQQKQVIMAKIPRGTRLVLVDADGAAAAQNAAMMASMGHDARHLEGGMAAWAGPTAAGGQAPLVSGGELWGSLGGGGTYLLDVREPEEYAAHRIEGAVNVPLARLFEGGACDAIPRGKRVVTICSHGNRSMVATFALARAGIESSSLDGGMAGWSQILVPKEIEKDGETRVIQVEKVGKGCLSYIVARGGKGVVIDAVHPVAEYARIAEAEGVEITAVADTHCHADHVSASRELAASTGAALRLSAAEAYDLECERIADGGAIPLGDSEVRAVHTPGHTPGSMAYVIGGLAFCGDTAFAGGVGRPDLHEDAAKAAGDLHDTLHGRIGAMDGATRLLPAHRAEGAAPSPDGSYGTTVGELRAGALYGAGREAFVRDVTASIPEKPPNHAMIVRFNRGSMPLNPAMIPDLEAGPNRCAVAAP